MARPYEPQDCLSLWWLGDPHTPRRVGEIAGVMGGRSVSLCYADAWRKDGFALSEDLPLLPGTLMPKDKDSAVGAVEDARPDRWGERVIRRFESTQRLSLLEFLLFAGDDRYGGLGVSTQADSYQPWPAAPLPQLGNLQQMAEAVRKILANEDIPETQRRLIRPGASLGGARPKSLLEIDGEPWLVKFAEDEEMDTPLIEHATLELARACGICAAQTRALPVGKGHAVAVRRFDRNPGQRLHALSAHVALRAAGEVYGYPQLAQLLRRLSPAAEIAAEQEQLFRRMVFNILMDNTDDHEKNHALLRSPHDGHYRLSPAFDVVPAAQGLGYQALVVGDEGTAATLANALSQVRAFGMQKAQGLRIVRDICATVSTWKERFMAVGVQSRDMEQLAPYLDGPRLGDQRRAFANGL